jgi:hypothetical protein
MFPNESNVPIIGAAMNLQAAATNDGNPQAAATTIGKNHRAVKPQAGRKYVLLTKSLASWGKVPQQQADIAALLAESMEPGVPWTEEEVFSLVTEYAKEYQSLAKSVQHPTYLLAYYRGLKNDGKHAGFVGRDFLQVVG